MLSPSTFKQFYLNRLNISCSFLCLTTHCILLFYPYSLAYSATHTQPESVLNADRPVAEDQSHKPQPLISYETAQVIMHASAQILMKHQAATRLLEHCAMTFKHLDKSAQHAAQDWKTKHGPIVTRAKKIKYYIYQNIAQHDHPFEAEKLDLKIDAQIIAHIENLKTNLASNKRKQQHYLCNRLILSISAGEWDIDRVIPEHRQRILTFKLK